MFRWEKSIIFFVVSIENLKTLKYNIFSKKKTLVFSIICDKCCSEDEKIFEEEESIEILKIIGLINKKKKYQTNIYFKEKNGRT